MFSFHLSITPFIFRVFTASFFAADYFHISFSLFSLRLRHAAVYYTRILRCITIAAFLLLLPYADVIFAATPFAAAAFGFSLACCLLRHDITLRFRHFAFAAYATPFR